MIPCEKLGIKHVKYVKLTWMTNSLVGDHQVAVVNVDEGVLEGSDMPGTLIIINVIVTKDPNGK